MADSDENIFDHDTIDAVVLVSSFVRQQLPLPLTLLGLINKLQLLLRHMPVLRQMIFQPSRRRTEGKAYYLPLYFTLYSFG